MALLVLEEVRGRREAVGAGIVRIESDGGEGRGGVEAVVLGEHGGDDDEQAHGFPPDEEGVGRVGALALGDEAEGVADARGGVAGAGGRGHDEADEGLVGEADLHGLVHPHAGRREQVDGEQAEGGGGPERVHGDQEAGGLGLGDAAEARSAGWPW